MSIKGLVSKAFLSLTIEVRYWTICDQLHFEKEYQFQQHNQLHDLDRNLLLLPSLKEDMDHPNPQ